ncbi:hypothetical protein QUB63_01615 [Microcoleus sp. ARI1-B5]|uniref:hypothetical protein n=1 Tax=unclassified Microcoleus TaxID=2642155 RepID=UPI002FD1288D
MKKLIYAAAFTFVLASNAPATIAGGAMQNANVPHLCTYPRLLWHGRPARCATCR